MYYGYGMGYDPMYLLLIVVSTILGMATQGYIKSTYAKWSKVPLDSSLTGADVARRMLADEGVSGVGIEAIGGELTDNYDPRSNVLHLSQGNPGAALWQVRRWPVTRRATPFSTHVATCP